jgi:hypothetical protein
VNKSMGQRYRLSDRGVTRGLYGVNPVNAQPDAQPRPTLLDWPLVGYELAAVLFFLLLGYLS